MAGGSTLQTVKNVSKAVLKRKRDNQVLDLISPQNVTLSTGVTEIIQRATNVIGERVAVGRFTSEVDATINMTFGVGFQAELQQFNIGREFQSQNDVAVGIPFEVAVPPLPPYTQPARTTGQLGFGAPAPALGTAFGACVGANALSIPLTQVATITGDNQFIAGADGELTFSANLAGTAVTILYPSDSATRTVLSEIPVTGHELFLKMILKDLSVIIFEGFQAEPILDGKTIEFGAETSEVEFRLFNPPGQCASYNIVYMGQAEAC